MISIKNQSEIQLLRTSCQLAAQTLKYLGSQLKIGMSTEEINSLCHQYIISNGAIPSPLNYHGFPKSVCTSVNEVICHGIPSSTQILKNGDIINIDVTTLLNGFHGDTSATFLIGQVHPKIKKLVEVVNHCMMEGIKVCKPGALTSEIGRTIEMIVKSHGYTIVEEYCGHGIGREFHEEPVILHYDNNDSGVEMKPGMTFTIEPMINIGSKECYVLDDGWTVVTTDGSWSAQFEHTILITEHDHEILTLPD